MCSNLKLSSDIKLLISDFDGIFTDGGLYVTDEGKTSKKISFKDLMGISLAIKSGYKIAFISGEKTAAIDIVANRFKIEDVHQGIRDKKPIVIRTYYASRRIRRARRSWRCCHFRKVYKVLDVQTLRLE